MSAGTGRRRHDTTPPPPASAPAPPRRIAALAREHLAGCEYAAVVHKPFAIEEVLGIVARLLTA